MKKILMVIIIISSTLAYLISCDDSGSDETSSKPKPSYRMFVADGNTNGWLTNLTAEADTGIEAADSVCNSDVNRPDATKTYKALLVDGETRVACTTANCSSGVSEHVDWVLQPNARYFRADGTTQLFTTNSNGIVVFPDSTSNVLDTTIGGETLYLWTGLNADWTNGTDCSNWTSADSGADGIIGNTDTERSYVISFDSQACNTSANTSIACVEQPD